MVLTNLELNSEGDIDNLPLKAWRSYNKDLILLGFAATAYFETQSPPDIIPGIHWNWQWAGISSLDEWVPQCKNGFIMTWFLFIFPILFTSLKLTRV